MIADDDLIFMQDVLRFLMVVAVFLAGLLTAIAIVEGDRREAIYWAAQVVMWPIIYQLWRWFDRAVSAWAERAIARVREREGREP